VSYLEYTVRTVPTGARKVLYLHWPLVLLLCAVASVGFLMLYLGRRAATSAAGPSRR
jgi:rod shape determining protein RodA